MNKQSHRHLLAISCISAWFLWALVLIFVGPDDLGVVSVVLFLLSVGVALFTSFILVLYVVRVNLLGLKPVYKQFHIVFREGLLLTSVCIGSLIFLAMNLFSITNFILLIIVISLVEIFFINTYDKQSYKKARRY